VVHPIIAVFANRTTVPYPGAYEVFGQDATIQYACAWYWLVYSSAEQGHVLKNLVKGEGQDSSTQNCTEVLEGLNVTSQ